MAPVYLHAHIHTQAGEVAGIRNWLYAGTRFSWICTSVMVVSPSSSGGEPLRSRIHPRHPAPCLSVSTVYWCMWGCVGLGLISKWVRSKFACVSVRVEWFITQDARHLNNIHMTSIFLNSLSRRFQDQKFELYLNFGNIIFAMVSSRQFQ